MRRAFSLLALSVSLTVSPGATAPPRTSLPAPDEVRLKDGRVLVGTTRTVGKFLHVETLDGVVKVARADVSRLRGEAELRKEWEALRARTLAADKAAHGQVQLAGVARDWGLYPEMWEMVEGALQTGRKKPVVRRALRGLLAELEAEVLPRKWRKRDTKTRVRELLYRIRPSAKPGLRAAVVELLVQEKGANDNLRQRARAASKEAQRITAVQALLRRPTEGNDRFVYRTAILDGSTKVRRGAADTIRENGETKAAVRYLAPGLMHAHPQVRIRTAEAYGRMLDGNAIDILVSAGPLAGRLPKRKQDAGGSVRGHIAIIDQTSYVRDFDVEVAQAAFIADPKVDVLQSGVVMDVTVHAVVTYRTEIIGAYRNALRRLAGSDPGYDPRRWAAWRAGLSAQTRKVKAR